MDGGLRFRAGDRIPGRGVLPRVVVYGLLALIALTVVANAEYWPLSSFRLFSRPRGPVEIRWQLVEVESDGTEAVVDFSDLGRTYRSGAHLLRTFPSASAADRADACAAWESALDARHLVVYRSEWTATTPDEASRLIARKPIHDCALP